VARQAERLPLSEAEAILSPILAIRTERAKPKRVKARTTRMERTRPAKSD
jgi:hypothetical protein